MSFVLRKNMVLTSKDGAVQNALPLQRIAANYELQKNK